MNFGIVSLIALFIVIAVAFVKKMNAGVLAMAIAMCLGYMTSMYTKSEILKGYSGSLFITLFGLTMFFGILNDNGCLNLIMKKLINLFGKAIWLAPILIFFGAWAVSSIAGGFAGMAFACGITMSIVHATGYNPIMMMIISNAGAQAGRYTRISPDGNIVTDLLAQQGISGGLFPLTVHMTTAMIIISLVAFIYFKGYKVKGHGGLHLETEKLSFKQIEALIVFLVVIFLIIGLGKDSGFMGVIGSVVLVLLNVTDTKNSFKVIPWNTIMMVTGVGMLMHIVIASGGIDVLTSIIAGFTTPFTVGAVSCMTASIMSWFSSTLGVVVPTLTPTVSTLAEQVGGTATPIGILSCMLIGSSSACFSPASSVGGLILATVVGDEVFKDKVDENKTFVLLFLFSICMAILSSLLSLTGIYSI